MHVRWLFSLMATALVAPVALAQTADPYAELSGTYVTTLDMDDLVAQGFGIPTDLVGTWTVAIHEDGHILWRYDATTGDRSYEMSSVYVVHDGRFLVGADAGLYPCQDLYDVTAGVYTWWWQDGDLAFTAVEDACPERRIILTARPLVPVNGAGQTDE